MGRNLLTYRQSQHNKTLCKLKCFQGESHIGLTNLGGEKVTEAYS